MAKKSHAKRNSHRNSHNNQAQNNGHSDERSRGRNRPRKKVRADSNVIELDPSGTLQTSYSPPRVMVPLAAKNPAQQQYIAAIKQYDLTFGIGPAGTGKSYCAGALAAAALETGRIERIILTRPAVEAGENLGFFTW
jgi:phosphate starvation-inducible PhoH-like protein